DGDITNQVKVLLGKVDPNKVGKYQLTYGVEDSKGNDAYKTITVEVIAEEAVTPDAKPTKPEQKPAVESTGTQMTLLGAIATLIMLILVTVRKRMRSR
ncbi:MAG: immunoglobulin-like domain-containing protein, partial [Mycoplasmatales bacterium]